MGVFSFSSRSGSQRTIRVEFINGADNSVIGVSEMPPDRLPDSFAIDTTLDIKDQKWSVQRAEPEEKTQFLKTGKLRLVLSRLTTVNPANILFSLPTISNDVGKTQGNTLPNEAVFAIHEDDWRQVEFVSARLDSEINQEFADIRQIWISEKKDYGFKKIHVRKRIPEPLAESSLHLDGLRSIIPTQKQFDGVGFKRAPGIIPQSFAWSASLHFVMWGIADPGGKVRRLCLSGLPERDQVARICAALAELTKRHQVHLVDWCRGVRASSDANAFETYFTTQFADDDAARGN